MLDLKEIEKKVYCFWKDSKIYEKLFNRKGKKKYYFLDGPPYANNPPHVGHIKNTVFKDILIRMAFMKGFDVFFKPGFDTHGLPVENMVEKKLDLNDKKQIEEFGIENFMRECKNNATIYKDVWMRVYEKLGSVYSLKEPYITYEDSYIESAWWSFSQIYNKKLVYEGEKPVMWCPHCETSLAGYEVTDSYANVQDPGIYVLFKLKDEDAYLLVYTTTPWTLPANVALAIAENEIYVEVEACGNRIILAKRRLMKLSEIGIGYRVLKEIEGKTLVGKKYEPLLNVPLQEKLKEGKYGKAHIVVASIPILKERAASKLMIKKNISGKDVFEEFVTMEEGTGIVHTAPGHGKTDYIVGQHYKLACVSPVDEKCHLTEESGFAGFVKEADKEILKRLEENKSLLYKETITHSYPLCWRCKSPLIFRLSKQLFLNTEKIRKKMLRENKKIKWMPEFAREKFENWVENAEDWNISRKRYWGVPIPLWKCECGNEVVVSSKKELEELSGEKINEVHSVEKIAIKCKKCGKMMKKFKGILDVWFDSGIAPWASIGYPLYNSEIFEKYFPVDRINEAQDQIRGWFYSLMYCSVAVFNKAPYKEVSMTGWVLDKNGNKMSKSLGNIVEAERAIDELGADLVRYYFCWDVAPYEIQKFNLEIAKKEIGKILNVLLNLPNLCEEKGKITKEIENKWILSRLESAHLYFEENLNKYELNSAFKKISNFILEDLSRRYVQMTRDKDNGKIISICLKKILRLLAPTIPFLSEYIWQILREKNIVKEESVHLCSWPKCEKEKINAKLEEEFENCFKIIEIGLAERDKNKIGLKWPLAKATIYCNDLLSEEIVAVIAKQINVKKIELKNNLEGEPKVVLDLNLTEELKEEGYLREIIRRIQAERKKVGLKKGELINLKVECDEEIKKIFEKNEDMLKEKTNVEKIEFSVGEPKDDNSVITIKEKKILIKICN